MIPSGPINARIWEGMEGNNKSNNNEEVIGSLSRAGNETFAKGESFSFVKYRRLANITFGYRGRG